MAEKVRMSCEIDPDDPRQAAKEVIAVWSAGTGIMLGPQSFALLLDAFVKLAEIERA